MTFTGMSHVAYATGNLDQTIRFWRDLLGLRMVLTLGKTGYKLYFFQLAKDQYIGFFEWPGVEPAEEKEAGHPRTGSFVFDHFALGVASEDDLWEIKDRLALAGEWVSEVIDHGFIRSIYAFDPNGIPLEFSLPAGMDLEHRDVHCDREPTSVALEGSTATAPSPLPAAKKTPRAERVVYPGFGAELLKETCP